MFAVKGWAVDAGALKPQIEPFKSNKKATQDDGQPPSRKRKRENAEASQQPDVGRLWEQHIEGKKPKKSKDRDRKGKERHTKERLDNGPEGDTHGVKPIKLDKTPTKSGLGEAKKKGKGQTKDQTRRESSMREDDFKDVVAPQKPIMSPAAATHSAGPKLTAMQAAMRQKLVSARFRHLNETLYTAPSDKALNLFDTNPEMFEDYHAGFRQQVSVWPENPVDTFIATIRSRGSVRPPKFQKHRKSNASAVGGDGASQVLPRTHGTCIFADLGCGDARLSRTLKDGGDVSTLNLKVHSFDLHSPSPLVTKADISQLPLADGSVDVAIFCLALMGTNWISFIEEAYRVLHWKGELWIAEIKSRFGRVGRAGARNVVEHSVGNRKKQAALMKAQEAKQKQAEEVDQETALRTEVDGVEIVQQETDVSAFVQVLRRRGFLLKDGDDGVDLRNKMFVRMEFVKAAAPTKGKNVAEPSTDKVAGPKMMKQKKKFIEDAKDEPTTDDEGKVLKPCLYKIR